jgi:alpha-D-xyloside xylohydrolase
MGASLRGELEDDRGGRLALEIRPVAPNMIRVHVGPGAERPSRLLTPEAPASADWSLGQHGAGWSISTSVMTLDVDREPYRLRLTDRSGRELFVEEPLDRDIRMRYHHRPSGYARGLAWLTARLRADEALFGLGEHFGAMNRRGQAFAAWTSDAYGIRSDRAYKNLPLLVSSQGYAVFFDMTSPFYYDLGQASTAAWQATARANHLRFYLMVGDGIPSLLHGYQALTGTPAIPPAWSFGLWMSRWGYRDRKEVMAVARRLRAEAIPCDVIHIDPYWLRYHEGHHCDLTWDEKAFPRPAEMIGQLKSMGFRVSLWESPYVPTTSEMFRDGRRRGFLFKDRAGKPALVRRWRKPSGVVDFTNPAAVGWFKDRNRRVLEMGVAGSQRYPVQWGGDAGCTFEDMAASLRGALNWVMSGVCFSSFDMGGFFGLARVTDPPDPELYVRWCQMGLLFSHARVHGHTSPREPWEYGPRALEIFRRYANLRYRLLPYLYSAALDATGGIPLARPLIYDHPHDRTTYNIDDQYLLGPDLLVAPMFKPEGTRDIYLPAGDWYDYWTDQRFAGPRWIAYEASLDIMPLFVRAGAVLPLGPELRYSDERAWDPLTLEVYPGADRVTELRDDRRQLRFEVHHDREKLRVDGGPLDYDPAVRIHRPEGRPIPARLSQTVSLVRTNTSDG